MDVVGGFSKAQTILDKASANRESAYSTAGQLDHQSGQVFGSGTRKSNEIRRQGSMRVGDASAALGASGSVGSGNQVLADLQVNSEFNAMAALFDSATNARNLRTDADRRRREADRASKSARREANSAIFSSVLDFGIKAATGGVKP